MVMSEREGGRGGGGERRDEGGAGFTQTAFICFR